MTVFEAIFLTFVILLLSYSPINVAGQSVMILDASNLRDVIGRDSYTLVSFYAPWCGHCTTMAPELKNVAKIIHEENLNAKIAIMDATLKGNEAILVRENIDGYPSLILYRNGISEGTYSGPRTSRSIVTFLKKKLGSVYTPISSLKELMDIRKEVDADNNLSGGSIAVVLGLFPPGQRDFSKGVKGVAALTLLSVAAEVDFIIFLMADNKDLMKQYMVFEDSMLVFTGGAGLAPQGIIPLPVDISADEVRFQMLSHSIPLILNFNNQSKHLIQSLPIKIHILLFYPPIVPTPVPDPVPVSAASVDGDNDIRMDSDSNSGDKVSEVCGADGVCTEGDEDRMDHAHTDQKDRTRTSGDTVKKEDASTGSSNRNNFSAELLEGIKPLTHMDRVVTNIAERFRGRLIFIRIPATEHSLIQFFGLQQGLLPQVIAADMSVGSDLKRFNFHDYVARTAEYALQIDPHNPAAVNRFFTTDYLKMFLEDLLAGRLSPSLYSEEEVQIEDVTQSQNNNKNQEGDGKVYSTSIVGKNFNMRVVENEELDSFVYFFAPWCAFCKSFEIIFHELSRIFTPDSIQMVRLDATKNEVNHPKVHINSFPAFYFFTVGDKQNPIEYDGERSVVAIQKFIETFRSRGKKAKDDIKETSREGETNQQIENEAQIGEVDDQMS